MPPHIHMPIRLKLDALIFKQGTLATPTWSSTPFLIHHPMTRKGFCTWGVAKCPAHHPGMTRPACQGGNMAVRGYTAIRNLIDNV